MCMRVSVFFVNNNRVAFLVLLMVQSVLKLASEIHKCQLQCSGARSIPCLNTNADERKDVKP
jgi:hypothetical protein